MFGVRCYDVGVYFVDVIYYFEGDELLIFVCFKCLLVVLYVVIVGYYLCILVIVREIVNGYVDF